VAFGAELYSELVMLAGDEAARRLVARFPSHGVDVDDEATLREGDAPVRAAALRTVHGGSSAGLLERTGCPAEAAAAAAAATFHIRPCRRASATRRSISRSGMPWWRSACAVCSR
jgi:hypothetical protein